MAQVVLENVYKSFPTHKSKVASDNTHRSESAPVLRRINLTVENGEFMVLVGPSGCGKSTLLRLIAGLEDITGGNIWVENRAVNYLSPSQRNIAMVFQNYALYPHMTVYDNIAFGLRIQAGREERGRWGIHSRAEVPSVERSGVSEASPEEIPEGGDRGKLLNELSKIAENLVVAATRKLPKGLRYVSDKEQVVNERVSNVVKLLQIEELLNRYPKELSGGTKTASSIRACNCS